MFCHFSGDALQWCTKTRKNKGGDPENAIRGPLPGVRAEPHGERQAVFLKPRTMASKPLRWAATVSFEP
jgi:hypothetical protein